MSNLKIELMSTMAETIPFKHLVKQVQKAIDDYQTAPSEETEGYIIFTAQILLMKHVMQKGNMSPQDMAKEVEVQSKLADLFKENNN
jgi:hypothetical protein